MDQDEKCLCCGAILLPHVKRLYTDPNGWFCDACVKKDEAEEIRLMVRAYA